MDRRSFISGAASLAAGGLGIGCLGTPSGGELGSVRDLARTLLKSLDADTKKRLQVPYDHPLRQYHNRGVGLGGVDIDGSTFSWSQLKLIQRMFHSGLSEAGRQIVPEQYFLSWGGIRRMYLMIAGDLDKEHAQIIFSGPHINLRLGGTSQEGVAFGGPQVYGDQRGNESPGLPDNVYQYQLNDAWALYDGLSAEQKRLCQVPRAPIQTQIELQGPKGKFSGLPVKALSAKNQRKAQDLVEGILKPYHPRDVAYANQCLAKNGGLEGLHLAYYQDGIVGDGQRSQIVRLEGPAAVFYFRGAPHVHAFLHVAMDPTRPVSAGEVLGKGPRLEGTKVKERFERAMKRATHADLAYYPPDSVVGRLRPGTVRTGDIYNLESWGDRVWVVQMASSDLPQAWTRGMDRSVLKKNVTVALPRWTAKEADGEVVAKLDRLRDLLIADIKTHGLEG